MAEKQLNTRIQIKIDTENAWNLVRTTFVPLSGEMCIYRMNDGSIRSKIGDGRTAVGSLKFDDEAVRDLISTLSGTVSTLNETVSSVQSELNKKAPLASPKLTGTPTAPTASSGTNNTQIATTAFVKTAISGIDSGVDIQLSSTKPSGQSKGDIWLKIL